MYLILLKQLDINLLLLLLYLNRIFLHIGTTGSMLYNASLSIYFVSVAKFGITENAFKKKIEFWCHFVPIAFALCSSIFLEVGGYFNPDDGELRILLPVIELIYFCLSNFVSSLYVYSLF